MPYASKEKEREYQRGYHLRTWAIRKSRHKKLRNKRRALLADWLKTYKKDLVCVQCKENHPACLDFHHTNGLNKDESVSNMVSRGYSVENITKEIEKCIVLCRNCHAKAHYNQRSSRV